MAVCGETVAVMGVALVETPAAADVAAVADDDDVDEADVADIADKGNDAGAAVADGSEPVTRNESRLYFISSHTLRKPHSIVHSPAAPDAAASMSIVGVPPLPFAAPPSTAVCDCAADLDATFDNEAQPLPLLLPVTIDIAAAAAFGADAPPPFRPAA